MKVRLLLLGVIILLTTCNTISARAGSEDSPTPEVTPELLELDLVTASHSSQEVVNNDDLQGTPTPVANADVDYLKGLSRTFRHLVAERSVPSAPVKNMVSNGAKPSLEVGVNNKFDRLTVPVASNQPDRPLQPVAASSDLAGHLVAEDNVESPEGNSGARVAAQPASRPANAGSGRAPAGRWGLTGEQYFYSWSNNLGSNGYQSVTPLTLTYKEGDWDFGVRTAYIVSGQNQSITLNGQQVASQSGTVSTLSDTSISTAYNIRNGDMPIRLNLDLNIPTGRATLSGNEKLAIMDGSLVQQTRFGEGFNIAPGISVSKALGDRDVLGAGVSYIIRGQFDPNGDVVNDEIKPGNELVGTLQYQHVDSNWMVIGGLIYTNAGVTQRGGLDYYQKGDRLDANLTGIYVPFNGHRVQVAARYFTQSPDSVRNFFTGNLQKESANNNGNALFLGLDWGVALDARQQNTLHFLVDWLGVQANSYDRVNDLFNAGRDKFSVGLGYEFAASPTSRWSVQAKYFSVLDRATPITQQDITSSGFSLFGTVNFSF